MLRVKKGLDEVEVKFYHKWVDPGEVESMIGEYIDDERRCTVVTVSLNGEHFGNGISVCHPSDNFCKATGRKKALAYAMHDLDKSLRSAIWTEYEVQCGF